VPEAPRALRITLATIDGEAVVCGEDGVTDFDLLRSAVARSSVIGAP
jgi:ATP-dependent DNA ligase